MHDHGRRVFVGGLLQGGLGAALVPRLASAAPGRRFTVDLVCGAIGVRVPQREAVELAAAHGFESVGAQSADLMAMTEADLAALQGRMAEAKLRWGAANLPADFRRDDETFRQTAADLPAFAKAARRAGVTRVGTWLMPASDTLTYRKYFDLVAARLREVAQVLGSEGLRLGLEYVGPKTAWSSRRYPFVHTLAETRELIEAIGVRGVGLVLDSWHWFLAGDTLEDLAAVRNDEVVAVDLNDAPAGIPNDQQVDNARELPAATGVIPAAAFLRALVAMGYDGPVRAEPFNQALNALPKEQAVAETAAAMKKAMALLG
jgi:sugar phosphate isomerase/epimerase